MTTDYEYAACCGSLLSITYSDGTPGVTFTLDRLGRQTTITDATGTRNFSYNDQLLLAAETNVMGVISQQYDSIGRNSGFAAVSGYQVNYGYSALGHFSAVTSGLSVVNYAYAPNSDILAGYTLADPVANFQFQVSRAFEPHRDLITSISNTWNGAPVGNFAYANDLLARRVARIDNESISNVFGYNLRSEVTSAAMGTNTYRYVFDAIGNRQVATNNDEILAYFANALNQYTNILRISAPPRETLPTYDLDGNMTFLPSEEGEGWHCQWDGENRLAGASNAAVNARYSYDYMSRRSQKIAGGVTNRFLYDGWNLIAEVITENGSAITNLYTWGLDIAEQMGAGVPRHSAPGATAGGIGGLLSVTHNGATYFPCSDANGNITDYVDTNGTVVAHREFDAFGNTILATGPLVHDLHFWFSSKYLDEETGLYYFGYRYYSPELGRWLPRDPIGEQGGGNQYSYTINSTLNSIDVLGQTTYSDEMTGDVYGHARDLKKELDEGVVTITDIAIDGSEKVSFTTSGDNVFEEAVENLITYNPGQVKGRTYNEIVKARYLGAGFAVTFSKNKKFSDCCKKIIWRQVIVAIGGKPKSPPEPDYQYISSGTSDFPGQAVHLGQILFGKSNYSKAFKLECICVDDNDNELVIQEIRWSFSVVFSTNATVKIQIDY